MFSYAYQHRVFWPLFLKCSIKHSQMAFQMYKDHKTISIDKTFQSLCLNRSSSRTSQRYNFKLLWLSSMQLFTSWIDFLIKANSTSSFCKHLTSLVISCMFHGMFLIMSLPFVQSLKAKLSDSPKQSVERALVFSYLICVALQFLSPFIVEHPP